MYSFLYSPGLFCCWSDHITLYSEALNEAFSFGWNAQHNFAHKISKLHTLSLVHFITKCCPKHWLMCWVTVTLAIHVSSSLLLHSASCPRLLVLVAQLPGLHWHWTRDSRLDVRRKPQPQWAPLTLVGLVPCSSRTRPVRYDYWGGSHISQPVSSLFFDNIS